MVKNLKLGYSEHSRCATKYTNIGFIALILMLNFVKSNLTDWPACYSLRKAKPKRYVFVVIDVLG
jgi:hypothetical protein